MHLQSSTNERAHTESDHSQGLNLLAALRKPSGFSRRLEILALCAALTLGAVGSKESAAQTSTSDAPASAPTKPGDQPSIFNHPDQLQIFQDSLSSTPRAPISPAAPQENEPPKNFATKFKEWLYRRIDQGLVDLVIVTVPAIWGLNKLLQSYLKWQRGIDDERITANWLELDGSRLETKAFLFEPNISRIWVNPHDRGMILEAVKNVNKDASWTFLIFPDNLHGREIFSTLISYISAEIFKKTDIPRLFKLSMDDFFNLAHRYDAEFKQPERDSIEIKDLKADNSLLVALSYDNNRKLQLRINPLLITDAIRMLADLRRWYEAAPIGNGCTNGDKETEGDSLRLVRALELASAALMQQPEIFEPFLSLSPGLKTLVYQRAHDLSRLVGLSPQEGSAFLKDYMKNGMQSPPDCEAFDTSTLDRYTCLHPKWHQRLLSAILRKPLETRRIWFTLVNVKHC